MAASPRHLRARARAAHALQLRAEGHTFAQIAEIKGYSDGSGARRAVMRALQGVESTSSKEIFWLEMFRLERLLTAVWDRAIDGQVDYIDRALRIIQTRLRAIGADRLSVTIATDRDEQGAVRVSDLTVDQLRQLQAIHRTATVVEAATSD